MVFVYIEIWGGKYILEAGFVYIEFYWGVVLIDWWGVTGGFLEFFDVCGVIYML